MSNKYEGQLIDDDDDFYDDDPVYCDRCDEYGMVIICPDDMCHGQDECMHGDGEIVCPSCGGGGKL